MLPDFVDLQPCTTVLTRHVNFHCQLSLQIYEHTSLPGIAIGRGQ